MISTTSVQSTIKAIQTKFIMKHKFGQNKTLPNWENAEETTKQHQIEKHLRESKHSHNLTKWLYLIFTKIFKKSYMFNCFDNLIEVEKFWFEIQ